MQNEIKPIDYTFSPYTVVVSRVRRFLDFPSKIYPVSCTNVVVEDTYFDDDLDANGDPLYNFYETIAGSNYFVKKVLKGNAGVVVDLSNISPKGTIRSNGMVAAGVTNFLTGYSVANSEIRRGSAFRNGAVVVSLDSSHPDLNEFITAADTGQGTNDALACLKRRMAMDKDPMSRADYAEIEQALVDSSNAFPWLKRAVVVDEDLLSHPDYDAIEQGLSNGSIFLHKKTYNSKGERLWLNVCCGITFKSRSTCTLAHVNLGLVKEPEDLPFAFMAVAEDLDYVWELTNKLRAEHFIAPEEDKQVGMGVVGLANFLAQQGVSYYHFTEALHGRPATIKADKLVEYFFLAYRVTSAFAIQKGYDRFFTIEPTATCSYKQKDLRGYVTTPEISPPVADPVSKITRRLTDEAYQDYQYPLDAEVAGHDVGWQVYDDLCIGWQEMMNVGGQAHAISYNWWLSKPVNKETIQAWLESPLKSVYYRWQEIANGGDKTTIGEQSDDDLNFWGGFDDTVPPADFSNASGSAGNVTGVCAIDQYASGYCAACEGE